MPWGPRKPEVFVEQIVQISCMHCAEFAYEGPLEEGRTLHAEHRLDVHGIETTTRRRSGRSPWRSKKSLDENINTARTEGAATWVGREDD